MAVQTNRDQWVQNFANAIGQSGENAASSNEGGNAGATDKYTTLETTSYKDMLSSKIQAANAKDQAMKYANASLNASGLGNQGIAESTRTGIYGTYQRAINEADQTHQSNLLDIQTQKATEQEENQESSWQSAMTMMQQASSQEDLDYLKDNFYEGMTDEQKKMFDYYYASYSNSFADESANTASEYSYDDNKAYAYDANGGSITTSGKFNKENETLKSAIATGKIAKGTYIQMHNLSNQDMYLYYGNDGKLYYVSKDVYNNSEKKVHIYGKESGVNDGAYTG